MANRNNKVLLKRSNVIGKVPLLTDLTLGEIALNTADAKIYSLYTNGGGSPIDVREIGWDKLNLSGGVLTGSLTGTSLTLNNSLNVNQIILSGVNISTVSLTGLSQYNTNGIVTQTSNGSFTGRTLQAPTNGFTITNPNGVNGNPTFSLSDDLLALENLSATGISVRTGSNTWTTRLISGATNQISISNGDGVSNNPTISLSDIIISGSVGSSTSIPSFTYDSKGRITSTYSTLIPSLSALSGTNTGDETTASIKLKLGSASGSQDGYLLQTDWITFNNKQNALGFTPENSTNKTGTVVGNETSTTLFAHVKGMVDWVTSLFVPKTRNITINGTTQDLSADRSWTVSYIETLEVASTVISFTDLTIYNSVASPATGNISDNLVGAKKGIIQKIYHNHSAAPTFPAGWVIMGTGTYVPSVNNIIYAEWVSGTRVEYWIVQ